MKNPCTCIYAVYSYARVVHVSLLEYPTSLPGQKHLHYRFWSRQSVTGSDRIGYHCRLKYPTVITAYHCRVITRTDSVTRNITAGLVHKPAGLVHKPAVTFLILLLVLALNRQCKSRFHCLIRNLTGSDIAGITAILVLPAVILLVSLPVQDYHCLFCPDEVSSDCMALVAYQCVTYI